MPEGMQSAAFSVRACLGTAAAVLRSMAVAGLAALLEAASQLLRFGTVSAPLDGGWAALLLSPVLPAMAGAGLLTLLVAGVLRGWPRLPAARRAAWATALSLAGLAALAVSHVLRERFPDWWEEGPDWQRRLALAVTWAVVALLLVRWQERWRAAHWRPRRCAVVVVLLLAAGGVAWQAQRAAWRDRRLGGIPLGTPAPGAPDLVLVTVDTWRADFDHLPGVTPPTPVLDSLTTRTLRFDNAWSSASWTLPSMATLLTGWPPRVLGVARYHGLPPGTETLAVLARRAGYDTWALVANPYLTPEYGFARGFARYDHARRLEWLLPAARSVLVRELAARWQERWARVDAAAQIGKARRWLSRRRSERPLFLWIHLMDPHLPYRRHTPADFPAAACRSGHVWCAPAPPADPLFTRDGLPATALDAVRRRCPDLPDSVTAALRALYAGEVAYTDAWLGELWRALAAGPRWERTLLVLAADHGEELLDHGGFEHGHSLMPEVTRVPLLIRLPGGVGAGRRLTADHRTLDLVPSLCRYLGWPVPAGLPGGAGLWAPDDSTGPTPPAVMENMLYGPARLGLRLDHWLRLTTAEGDSAWYDLATDPTAHRPLPGMPPGAGPWLVAARRRLAVWDSLAAIRGESGDAGVTVDSQLCRQLRSLGY